MKKLLVALLVTLSAVQARAQVFIINDNMMVNRLATIQAVVVDSLTREPLPFASFYVVPAKDTTISNFTLTDDKGHAKLEDVPLGSYVLRAEMMGYKPFVLQRYFRDRETDLGTILLQPDPQYLKAAVVNEVGNSVVVKKDTVEFMASSFRVGANDMLKDLIKRMPGMEITDNGKVKFNGQEIDKLTVSGRTFFFDDQSTALNNLPAGIVDKIRVVDRESDAARATGRQDTQREKELDVVLKKEYEKGWFGNVGINGGTTLAGKNTVDAPLRDNRGFLFSGNALASAYSEKDQLTVLANAQNVDDSEGAIFVRIEGEDLGEIASSLADRGLSTSAQLGVNLNTSRIKDVETTLGANYKFGDTQTGSRSERTTYQEDGVLVTNRDNSGRRLEHSVGTDLEFEKEEGKVWFHLSPSLGYSRTDATALGMSETLREGNLTNRSKQQIHSLRNNKNAGFTGDVTIRELGGKKGRSLRFVAGITYNTSSTNSEENSALTYLDEFQEEWALTYKGNNQSFTNNASVTYNDSFGEKWSAQLSASYRISRSDGLRDAYDEVGWSEYFSSQSRNRYFRNEYGLEARYNFNRETWLSLGGSVRGIINETYSKSYGIESTVGQGEWDWQVMPSMTFSHAKGHSRFYISAFSNSIKPSNSRMLPVLDVSDLSRLSTGNVYLKPGTNANLFGNWTLNNPERFSNFMLYASGSVTFNAINNAQWYDEMGILYSVPVNVKKPMGSLSVLASYTLPLDSKRIWTLSLDAGVFGNFATNYLAQGALAGLDPLTFDYSKFMANFWGNAAGDRFYSGKSGFKESSTLTISPTFGFDVRYNQERYSLRTGADANGQVGIYSQLRDAPVNTLSARVFVDGSYTTRNEFEFQTDLGYRRYWGYADGFNLPELQWNASVTKSIGAFNLSLQVKDILNQTRNLSHTVTANYKEDTYRLVMGRYFLIGVKWNFGKMNAQHSRRAQRAAFSAF